MSTATAPSSTTSSLAISSGIPAIDQCLQALLGGGVSFTLFSCPFSTRLAFTGSVAVEVAPSGASATFAGRATLGAPFDLTADVVVTADSSGAWMVELTVPDVQRVADRAMDQVRDATAKSLYRQTVKPYLGFYRDAAVAIASEDTEDPSGRTVLGGINFYATFSPFAVAPLDALATTFSHVPLKTLTTTVHLACKKSVTGFAFLIAGEIDCNIPFGTPALALTQLALSIDQSTADLTAGISCRFTLRLDKEVLLLRGGATVDARGEARLSLALDAADGGWQSPFGIRGVTIAGLGIDVGAGPSFPWVIIGARGRALLGDGKRPLADAELGLLLDAASPERCVVSIHSREEIALRDLARALSPAVARLPLPDLALSELALDLSPQGGTIAGQTYAAGLSARGAIRLGGFRASAGGQIDYAGGFSLQGAMDPVDVVAGGVRVLQIAGAHPGEGAAIAIDCTPARQAASASLDVRLLGAVSAAARVEIRDPSALDIALRAEGDSVYAGATVRLAGSRATAAGNASFSYPFKVGGKVISVAMTAAIGVTVDAAKVACSEAVTFVAHIGKVEIPLRIGNTTRPTPTVAAASDLFRRTLASNAAGVTEFLEKVSAELAKQIWGPAATAIEEFYRNARATIVSGMLQFSGAALGDVALWTSEISHVSAEYAVSLLGIDDDDALRLLEDTFHMSKSDAEKAYKKVKGAAGDIIDGAADFFGL